MRPGIFGVRHRKRKAQLVDVHRFTPTNCWYCDKPLDRVFTTVRKCGRDLRVHPTCRPEALTVVDDVPPFISELPIG